MAESGSGDCLLAVPGGRMLQNPLPIAQMVGSHRRGKLRILPSPKMIGSDNFPPNGFWDTYGGDGFQKTATWSL